MHTKDDGDGGSYHKHIYIYDNVYHYYRVNIVFFICIHNRGPPHKTLKNITKRRVFMKKIKNFKFFLEIFCIFSFCCILLMGEKIIRPREGVNI